MKINQLKMGVAFNYAAQIVSILTGILYTPVMLRLLGQSEYGLYQLVYSVVSYLGLLSLGFGAGYVRFYSKYKAQDSSTQVQLLNGMYLIVFSVITVICILCGGLILFNMKAVFGTGLTYAEIEKAKLLLGLMVINTALAFMNSVFESYITVHERFFFNRGINFLHLLLSPFVTLPLLFIGFGSPAVISVNVAFSFSILIINIFYCFKNLKMKFRFVGIDFSLLKEIAVFTFFIFIIMIAERINISMGKFLLGRMEGTISVAIYGVASQINILYVNFSTAISQMFIPRVNMIVSKGNGDKELSVLFARVGRIQFVVVALIVSGFALFGKEFISIWAGSEYVGSYYVGIIILSSGVITLIQNLGVEIQKAKNMHKVCAVVNLLVMIANIFISIPLITKYSYIGAALGTAIAVLVGNLFTNWYYKYKIGLDVWIFWKEIFKFIPALTISIVLALVINSILPLGTGLVPLMVKIIIYSSVYAVTFWCIGLNSSEKSLITVPLKRILNKRG